MIARNMAGRTSGELTREFEAVRQQGPDIEKPAGHVSGISYRLHHVAVKGSGLGRGAYGFEGVQRELGVRYEPSRDLPELQRAARATRGRGFAWRRDQGLASPVARRLGWRETSSSSASPRLGRR